MSYENLEQNKIFSNQIYKDFDALNNLTREELREFINLVTIQGNNITPYTNNDGGKLVSDDNATNRIKLFLLKESGYTDVELFFSLNILIYLGDLYQKKAAPPFVFTSFEEIDKEINLNEQNRLTWLLNEGFRTEILNTDGEPIELNWGVNNFNASRSGIVENLESEIN